MSFPLPRSRPARVTAAVAAAVVLSTASFAGVALVVGPPLPAHATHAVTPIGLLTRKVDDATPNAEQLRRGQYLVAVGDCLSCHLRDGGEPFAGGLPLNTPFGIIYTSNITSDRETGIGNWTPDQFHRAMHDGIDDQGRNLYPAFPYPWFRRTTRVDNDAILAYLQSTPPVRYTPPANRLPFPLNIRFLVKGWNLLFLKSEEFRPDARHDEAYNRGAYLVDGLGHCGACHTPKNLLGADRSGQGFHGGNLDNWVAPDSTANPRTGLGTWTVDDIGDYLRNGRNRRAGAGGPMAEVIEYSTSILDEADRRAIATFLKAQPPSHAAQVVAADPGAMKRGGAIYSDVCSACHLENGVGQPLYFPPLGNDAMLQQTDPAGLLHVLLAGSRIGVAPHHPTPLTMPSYAWKLSDAEIADVATFVRNSWGNEAQPVAGADVAKLRKKLNLETEHLTMMSGDR